MSEQEITYDHTGVWDDDDTPPLPTDALIAAFLLDSFRRTDWRGIQRNGGLAYGRSTGIQQHLAECPDAIASPTYLSDQSSCGEGTCEIPPVVIGTVSCPHRPGTIDTSVSDETLGALLNRIATFAETTPRTVEDVRAEREAEEAAAAARLHEQRVASAAARVERAEAELRSARGAVARLDGHHHRRMRR